MAENYVEDDDNMFRFDYSTDFLKWDLLPPLHASYKEWIIGVRIKSSGKIVGFISGVPVQMKRDVCKQNVERKRIEQREYAKGIILTT